MNNPAIQNFTYDTLVIKPLSEIITNLENGVYLDGDLAYLNAQLKKYAGLALEFLNLNLRLPAKGIKMLNQYGKEQFLKYFGALKSFFVKAWEDAK